MRVALVVHKLAPESVGGTELYTQSLARNLASLGHEVSLFCPTDAAAESLTLDYDGVAVWRAPRGRLLLPGPAGVFWRAVRDRSIEASFRRFLRQRHPDVVHVQHLQGVSAKVLALASHLPVVVTLHDYWYLCPNSQLIRPDATLCPGAPDGAACAYCGLRRAGLPGSQLLRRLVGPAFAWRQRLVRSALQNAHLLIAPSVHVRERYLAADIEPQRIIVVPHGLDEERLQPQVGDRRFERARPRFGYVGNLAWQKGVHVLLEAFEGLPQEATLTVYGDPSVFPTYAAELRAGARHSGVRFMGALPPSHVGDALRGLDYVVVPSLWEETFSLVAQEALGVGVPVIASDIGALPERVEDGVTGRLVPPGDVSALRATMRECAARPELHDAYAANIRRDTPMSEHARRLFGIYGDLVRKGAARA